MFSVVRHGYYICKYLKIPCSNVLKLFLPISQFPLSLIVSEYFYVGIKKHV